MDNTAYRCFHSLDDNQITRPRCINTQHVATCVTCNQYDDSTIPQAQTPILLGRTRYGIGFTVKLRNTPDVV
jgi:hypothetical protein